MKKRLGKSRYGIYEFPTLDRIEKWSRELFEFLHNGLEHGVECSEWEKGFIQDIRVKVIKGIELSEETVYTLEQLYSKYTN